MRTSIAEREKDFMQAVIQMARALGWLCYHPFDSRRSAAGYPDLTLAKPHHPLILAETKRESGILTPDQQTWLRVLSQTRAVHVDVWRPSHWDEIEAILRGKEIHP